MEWILYRYPAYRVLRYDYNVGDAWTYGAGGKQHMLDGFAMTQAVKWKKTSMGTSKGLLQRPWSGASP